MIPGFLTDLRFWMGLIIGYLLVSFVPQISASGMVKAKGQASA